MSIKKWKLSTYLKIRGKVSSYRSTGRYEMPTSRLTLSRLTLGADDSLKDKLKVKKASMWMCVLHRSSDARPVCSCNNQWLCEWLLQKDFHFSLWIRYNPRHLVQVMGKFLFLTISSSSWFYNTNNHIFICVSHTLDNLHPCQTTCTWTWLLR